MPRAPGFSLDEAAEFVGGMRALDQAIKVCIARGVFTVGQTNNWMRQKYMPAGPLCHIIAARLGMGALPVPDDPVTEEVIQRVRRIARRTRGDGLEWRALVATLDMLDPPRDDETYGS